MALPLDAATPDPAIESPGRDRGRAAAAQGDRVPVSAAGAVSAAGEVAGAGEVPGAGESASGPRPGAAASPSEVALTALDRAAQDLADTDLAAMTDDQLHGLLRRISAPLRQLSALRTRGAGELQARAVARADGRRAERALQDNRRRLREELDLTPSEAKHATQTGHRLQQAPAADQAYAAGRLSDAHARVITDTLAFVPRERHTEVEARLVRLAATMDAVALGRAARRILAEVDYAAAERREQVQHERRSVRLADTEDGGVHLSARLYGLQAEKLRTAMDAFTQPDPANARGRSYEQRSADALENLLDAALQSGDAPTQHGVRPHVLAIVQYSDLALGAGIAELGFTGPITMTALRPLLSDCKVSRIIMGPDSVPLEAGEAVRTVPAGLWRALVARDRGCTWERCEAPPSHCDAAHGQMPFRDDGRLSLDNAALLCRRHHRRFDLEKWRIHINGPTVTYTRADRRP